VGALPGGSVLSNHAGGVAGWFDVDPFRTAGRRVVVRSVDRAVLVLGSTQSAWVAEPSRLRAAGVELARRRSGGGAVLLEPGAQTWVDVWVPRDDPLWEVEPRRSAERVGEWWAASLPAGPAREDARVHRGTPTPGPSGDLVCFAGVAAGEVVVRGRKLVGLAQWRSREGALVHGCAYRSWDPGRILALLDPVDTRHLGASLAGVATGLDDVGAPDWTAERLVAALPEPGSWQVCWA
jgi:lipoate---protein ligase